MASWCPQNRPRESQLGSHSGGQACGQGRGLSRPAASVGPGLGGRGGQRPPLGMGEQPGLRTPRLGRGPTSPAPSPLRRGREETPQHSLLIARAPNRGRPAPPLTRSRPRPGPVLSPPCHARPTLRDGRGHRVGLPGHPSAPTHAAQGPLWPRRPSPPGPVSSSRSGGRGPAAPTVTCRAVARAVCKPPLTWSIKAVRAELWCLSGPVSRPPPLAGAEGA